MLRKKLLGRGVVGGVRWSLIGVGWAKMPDLRVGPIVMTGPFKVSFAQPTIFARALVAQYLA
jgi:hypothetical protein